MKLTINRESLLPIIEKASGVVETRSTTPVLSNVLLSASEKGLQVTGTDLDTEITGYIDNTGVEAYGSTTVSAKKIFDICKALPVDSIISIELEGDNLVLKSSRSSFKLATLPTDDFSVLDSLSFDNTICLVENEFLNLLKQTSYAMAQHDVRYYLNGMLLTTENNKITVVATDGHRLASSSLSLPDTVDADSGISIIIPRKGVSELSRLLDSNVKTTIELQLSSNHIRLQKDNLQFTSKLIDGKYPDYKATIPQSTQYEIEIDKQQITDSLVRVAILSNDKFRGVSLKLTENLLTISSDNPDRETAEESIDINYTGDTLEVGFNVNYLLDAVKHLSGDTITFVLNTVESSTLIHSRQNPNSLCVVMPVRF